MGLGSLSGNKLSVAESLVTNEVADISVALCNVENVMSWVTKLESSHLQNLCFNPY